MINVASIFGIGSIRIEKRLDLVVTLKDWQDMEEIDRVGLEQEFYQILNINVPHVTIPVRPGRDMARLVEVAALDQKLKSHGQHGSLEFNQRLLNLMHRKQRLMSLSAAFLQQFQLRAEVQQGTDDPQRSGHARPAVGSFCQGFQPLQEPISGSKRTANRSTARASWA